MNDTIKDVVKGFQEDVRGSILTSLGSLVKQSKIEEFKEKYDKKTQTWTFEIAFNEGDIRSIEIILNIDPDREPSEIKNVKRTL